MGLMDQMKAKYRLSLEKSVSRCQAKKKIKSCLDCGDFSFCHISKFSKEENK